MYEGTYKPGALLSVWRWRNTRDMGYGWDVHPFIVLTYVSFTMRYVLLTPDGTVEDFPPAAVTSFKKR